MTNLINLGTIIAPYREFNFAVAAGSIYNLRYDHQIIEVLENSAPNDVHVCFGGSGGFTELQTGIAYKYPDENIVPYVQFRNDGATTAQLKVALASGQIIDNRFVTTGILSVQSSTSNPLYSYTDVYTTSSAEKLTIAANGQVTMSSFSTGDYKRVLIQNTSSADIRIEDANDGFILPPQATFEWKVTNSTLTFYGSPGQTLWVEGYK